MLINIPSNVNSIIKTLQEAGYSAFTVGGAVRDSLMGREVSDWDVTTSAHAREVERVFSSLKVIETGLKHGTVTLLSEGEPIEVTTFRIDGGYSDGRHPDSVSFTGNVEDDLARRDFTVNAMAYNDTDGLVDVFGGREDIENRLIRCVGKPELRFGEDALRILRALRFSSVLSFGIEEATADAIMKLYPTLEKVSVERITKELLKLLGGRGAVEVITSYPAVFSFLLPELDTAFSDVALKRLPGIFDGLDNPLFRLAALCVLARINESNAAALGSRLRLSNAQSRLVCTLCTHSRAELSALSEVDFKLFLGSVKPEEASNILTFQSAFFDRNAAFSALRRAESIYRSGECINVSMLKIKGSDLSSAGFASGSGIGEMLTALLHAVVSGEANNNKSDLLKKAEELYQQQ